MPSQETPSYLIPGLSIKLLPVTSNLPALIKIPVRSLLKVLPFISTSAGFFVYCVPYETAQCGSILIPLL